jgi:hypothetical protein
MIAGPLPTRGRIATAWIVSPHFLQKFMDGYDGRGT